MSLPDDPAEPDAALDRAFQDVSDSDNLAAAIVLGASTAEIKAIRSDGDAVVITGEGPVRRSCARGQGPLRNPDPPRRRDPREP